MYADKITDSMAAAIGETDRRRAKQLAYNAAHGIVPKTIVKEVRDVISAVLPAEERGADKHLKPPQNMSRQAREKLLRALEKEMKEAARRLEFEEAAQLRDAIMAIRAEVRG
jgi:excinuclease ABC subunit B